MENTCGLIVAKYLKTNSIIETLNKILRQDHIEHPPVACIRN